MKNFIFLTLLCNFFGCYTIPTVAQAEEFCKMKLIDIEGSPQYTKKMKQCVYFVVSSSIGAMKRYNEAFKIMK